YKAAFIEKFKQHKANLFSKPNEEQVLIIGLFSFLLAIIFIILFIWFLPEDLEGVNGIWTLITAIISSPILYLIWRFRDQNATRQIENQRKDINLKEFQKIAEWVSGLHLIEDEVTEKIANQPQQETTRKYTQQAENLSIPTFSKKDGAVGLQIAAIYNLLPFYRGEHGESFKKPALNLLLSAWLALQQKEVKILESLDIWADSEKFETTVDKIKKNGQSPIGIAITQVLLADGGKYLVQFPEIFPNLCLAGMDFHLPGLDKGVLNIFTQTRNCQGIILIGCNLKNANLQMIDFSSANLNATNFEGACLIDSRLINTKLDSSKLNKSKLNGAKLVNSSVRFSDLEYVSLEKAFLRKNDFSYSKLLGVNFNEAELNDIHFEGVILKNSTFISSYLLHINFFNADLFNSRFRPSQLYKLEFSHINFNDIDLEINEINLVQFKLDGCILFSDTCNEEYLDLFKKQGGVVLYRTNIFSPSRVCIKKDNTLLEYPITQQLNLEQTQQENPDWEISIIE
ncbi:TPA: pentapeptide repeat-containing protein, partial [Pasteurella multocida]|nr:pentapeptide repeat-containing protein [Pasteurella multocida]